MADDKVQVTNIVIKGTKKADNVKPLDKDKLQKASVPDKNTDGSISYATAYANHADNLKKIRRNLNIDTGFGTNTEMRRLFQTQFNRFLVPFPSTKLAKGFGHVFFTRPDINVYAGPSVNANVINSVKLRNEVELDPLFYYIHKSNPRILLSLTKHLTTDHKFNPYLSNFAKNFDLQDDVIDVLETGETFTGYKIKYGRHNIKSKTAGTFSIRYDENTDYGIYQMHKAWTEYISKVYRGQFKAKDEYIEYRRLDYACSVYYFLCAADGETILFWSKYTGVFPSMAPSSASNWDGDIKKSTEYNIQYEYAWREDYNTLHLAEFNINPYNLSGSNTPKEHLSVYNPETMSGGMTFSSRPFVETITADNKITYKLRFAPSTS